MNQEEEEEEEIEMNMTEKKVIEICHKHNLYTTPHLNDILHLENIGFVNIAGLDQFIGLKVLWLNGNQITEITGLDSLPNLVTLYLQNNFIESLNGIKNLTNLEQLCISHNYLRCLDGIEYCTNLVSVDAEKNRISGPECIDALKQLKKLQIIQLADNKMEDPESIDVFESLPDLRVIHLSGNPIVKKIPMYRRTIISKNKELKCLDDTLITPEERRTVEAWARGGKEEERAERIRINDEKKEESRLGMLDFRRMQREAALNSGKQIHEIPELLSSDDERRDELMKAKFGRLKELPDGSIVEVFDDENESNDNQQNQQENKENKQNKENETQNDIDEVD